MPSSYLFCVALPRSSAVAYLRCLLIVMHKIIKASFVILMIFSLKAFAAANLVSVLASGVLSLPPEKKHGITV